LKWRKLHEAEFKLLDDTTSTNLQLLKIKIEKKMKSSGNDSRDIITLYCNGNWNLEWRGTEKVNDHNVCLDTTTATTPLQSSIR
jgi:hypothetical protein